MSGVTTLQKLKQSEIRVLKALQDREEHKFTVLKKETGLSLTSLSKALKNLQLKHIINRSITSRQYSIASEGLKIMKTKETVDGLMSAKTVRVETVESVPVDSIVAIDAPELSSAQQKVVMKGTVDIARAAFKQFFTNMQLREKDIPESGRIVYTASIDLRKAKEWLDSAEGKNYTITLKGED